MTSTYFYIFFYYNNIPAYSQGKSFRYRSFLWSYFFIIFYNYNWSELIYSLNNFTLLLSLLLIRKGSISFASPSKSKFAVSANQNLHQSLWLSSRLNILKFCSCSFSSIYCILTIYYQNMCFLTYFGIIITTYPHTRKQFY